MKFPRTEGGVVTVRGNKAEVRECYEERLKISKVSVETDPLRRNRNFRRRSPKDFAVLIDILERNADLL
jgi:hypothetical protein